MGAWVAESIKCLPVAQVMIPWDRAPRQAPGSAGSLLFPSPSPSAPVHAHALLLSLSNKIFLKIK